MNNFPILSRFAVLALTQLIGCASIVNGQNQSVSVEARSTTGMIVGASCQLTNNKGTWFLVTPGSTMVQRSFEDLAVKCEKDSFDTGVLAVKSSTKAMVAGNILFGGVIGIGVDAATGAAYDYPPLITVAMSSQQGKPVVIDALASPAVALAGAVPVAGASAPAVK